jgi:hypothetical protein
VVGLLVAALLTLSFWPAAITDRAFGGDPRVNVQTNFKQQAEVSEPVPLPEATP